MKGTKVAVSVQNLFAGRYARLNFIDELGVPCAFGEFVVHGTVGLWMWIPIHHILETNMRLRDHARVDNERPLITVITIVGEYLFQIIQKYFENNRNNK